MNEELSKQTSDLGFVPSDWDIKVFLDIMLGKPRNGLYKPKEFHGKGTKMVNMGELFAYDKIGDSDMELIELTDSEKGRFLLKNGDLVFARRSLLASGAGKCSLVVGSVERTFESSIIRVRPDSSKANSEYLFYFFSSRVGKHLLDSILRQVAVSGITGSDLMNLKIPLPSVQEQQSIAVFLAVLDAKISLNQRMNRTLETVGEAVFKRWFVDFEFPNQEGKPYNSTDGKMADSLFGEIPGDWQVGGLGDICEIIMGQSPPGETYNEVGEGIPFFQGVRDFGFRFPSKRVYCTAPTRFAEKGDVLLSVRAPVGSLNIADERCAIGRGVAALRLRGKQNSFLYYLLLATRMGWDKYDAKGTVFGSATKQDVYDFKIAIPPKNLRDKFGEFMEPLDKKILLNERESRNLTVIRDLLLPKLMSGKIRVPINTGKLEAT